jgi:hypothetical protein
MAAYPIASARVIAAAPPGACSARISANDPETSDVTAKQRPESTTSEEAQGAVH